MQRYSDGLKVPRFHAEVFYGKSAAVSQVVLDFKYPPTDRDHIQISQRPSAPTDPERFFYAMTVAGNTVTLFVRYSKYRRVNTVTGAASSGGAGADPHTHSISRNLEELEFDGVGNEALPPIIVHYEVA